jgi:hypothetical protein
MLFKQVRNINAFQTSAQHQCFLNKLRNINAF